MARGNHKNAQDRMTPFLSESKGTVTVETPDCTRSEDYEIFGYQGGSAGKPLEVRGQSPTRITGANSGTGKTLKVK